MKGKIVLEEKEIFFYPFLFERSSRFPVNLLELEPFQKILLSKNINIADKDLPFLLFLGIEALRAIASGREKLSKKIAETLKPLVTSDISIKDRRNLGRELLAEIHEDRISIYFGNNKITYGFDKFLTTFYEMEEGTLEDILEKNAKVEKYPSRKLFFFDKERGSCVLVKYQHYSNKPPIYYIGVWSGEVSLERKPQNVKYIWNSFPAGLRIKGDRIESSTVYTFLGVLHPHVDSPEPFSSFCIGNYNKDRIINLYLEYNKIRITSKELLRDIISYLKEGKEGKGIEKLRKLKEILHEVLSGITSPHEGDIGYATFERYLNGENRKIEIRPKVKEVG